MPTLPSGLEYEQLFELDGQRAYHEAYSRDNNHFVAHLAVAWKDAADFRREMLGYTEWNAGTPHRFTRTLPQLCPYTEKARCTQIDLVAYGRMPKMDSISDYDASVIAAAVTYRGSAIPDSERLSYFPDEAYDEWFSTHFCVYKCTFMRLPYFVMEDEDVDEENPSEGSELLRCVIRQRNNNVRELRIADEGFVEYDENAGLPADPKVSIPVNGFIPMTEAEMIYTWFQVPFDRVPRDVFDRNRLRVNKDDFDKVNGSDEKRWPAETMLFIDAKDIDVPYEGADGGLYVDPKLIFRLKVNYRTEQDDFVGHNHVYKTNGVAGGSFVKVVRRGTTDKFIYESSDEFDKLFTPLQD